MFSTSGNNMDNIHVSISDGESESEETDIEIKEEPELEPEQQEVLRKKIKKEHRKSFTTQVGVFSLYQSHLKLESIYYDIVMSTPVDKDISSSSCATVVTLLTSSQLRATDIEGTRFATRAEQLSMRTLEAQNRLLRADLLTATATLYQYMNAEMGVKYYSRMPSNVN
ncbi:hypothetical protein Cgig2_013608 [Carnegiea gigantea]|uniref:Uncharacterized protein n=1 Tax=Carnegiea gigantea TaxID=171969 RepID=A0A9Q1KBI8_9CARY|nr:hypothetical protein Cgig2_013608 [Carnegiea gigantea]